jgi:uncharacterized Rossmann fold enzyme
LSGLCSLYWDLCERAFPARSAYLTIVEPLMKHPRELELLAAIEASNAWRGSEEVTCTILEMLRDKLEGGEVCIRGPLPVDFQCEGEVFLVEGSQHTNPGASRILALVGDGDSDPYQFHTFCGPSRACFLHVHGDNIVAASRILRRNPWIIPTSQVYCLPPVLGVGGYTDGDRALIIAMLFRPRRITGIGFDFQVVFQGHKRWKAVARGNMKTVKLILGEKVLFHVANLLGYTVEYGNGILKIEEEN